MRRLTAAVLLTAASLAAVSSAFAQIVPALDATGAHASADAKANGGAASANANAAVNAAGSTGTADHPSGVPDHFPPTLPALSPQHPLAARERHTVAMATHWRNRAARPHIDAEGVIHFLQGDGEPVIICAPYKVCDISLEPGEIITDKPDIGDPRWLTHPRVSGTGASRTLHVIVKPSDAGLDSNMVIETDRRTVSVRLVSRASDYMPFVKLDSGGDASGDAMASASWASVIGRGAAKASASASPCDTVPVVPSEAYRIGDGREAWRPTQVYAVSTPVGIKTCIEFRADIGSADIPALVALDSSGNEQVVNYRQQGRRFLVDRLIDRAELVAGVGGDQDRVAITRRAYR